MEVLDLDKEQGKVRIVGEHGEKIEIDVDEMPEELK